MPYQVYVNNQAPYAFNNKRTYVYKRPDFFLLRKKK